jgi:hypothetical protein
MRIIVALVAIVGMVASSAVMAGFADYPARSIASVLAESAPTEDNEYLQKPGDRYFEAGVAVAKSRMVCSGSVRPLSEERQRFLQQYFQGRKQAQFADLFKDELLCREGSREHWLPIQAPLIPYFKKEVQPGKPVDLYVIFVGSFRSNVSELVENQWGQTRLIPN